MQGDGEEMATSRFVPRLLLVDETAFGDAEALAVWLPATDLRMAGQLVVASWQHGTSIVIRDWLTTARLTQAGLASHLGLTAGMLSGKLTGRYPVTADEMFAWPLAFDDITMLPPAPTTAAGLLPGPTLRKRQHRYAKLPKF